jgi:AmmeMemoRadiSam system protein B
MIRKPAVSGQFYPANKDEINSLLHQFIDNQAVKHETVGLVLPHAGYVYSGAVAGATISRIRLRQTAVILGPNHTGMGKPFAIMTEGSWQTPLGEVEVASTLARHILSLSRYLEDDTIAHRYEHSIEVQLPFLQYFALISR